MIYYGKKILLIQPRHTYAPPTSENKFGHIYMPTSLLAAAAIFLEIGINIELIDENIFDSNFNYNIVGLNLLGAPYIPAAIEIEKKLKDIYNNDFKLLLGGQIVNGLSDIDFINLFTSNTSNGNSYNNIRNLFNLSEVDIPRIENISFQKVYGLLGDELLDKYLRSEFSFYLSQGCKYSCSFCSARRTINLPNLRLLKREKEIYRNIDIALGDFEYLIKKAMAFNISKIKVYLSNLDLFQNPLELYRFSKGMTKLKNKFPSIEINLRGLSNTRSFLQAHSKYSYVIQEMTKAGLYQLGFGIDGATQKVYKETRKPQTVPECNDAIRIAYENYNINPETLMVFGHNNKEDESALELAVTYCNEMQQKYRSFPRPHVAKDIIPGNDGWLDPANKQIINNYYENPILFKNLDFTALPSPITHPNKEFRELVTKYYKMVCELPNSLTQYILPELPNMSPSELMSVRLHNQERYDI